MSGTHETVDHRLEGYESPKIEVLGDVDSLTGSGGMWFIDLFYSEYDDDTAASGSDRKDELSDSDIESATE